VAGYLSFGIRSTLPADYAINHNIVWNGSSSWWIVETVESFNGHMYQTDFGAL
jgi:hypothetical protein